MIIWTSQSEIRIITIEKTKTMQEIRPQEKKKQKKIAVTVKEGN